MKSTNNKILVKVDPSQKDTIKIGETVFSTANIYETNYRYKSPTICEVVNGNKIVKPGDVLLCHHNLFYLPSPFHLQDDLFSIPFSKVLFAKIDADGNLDPICGNMLCKEIEVETLLSVPPEFKTFHKNRYEVVNPGWCKEYKIGDIVFTRPSTGYSIIWNWNKQERTTVKCDSDMVCGILRKKKKNSSK